MYTSGAILGGGFSGCTTTLQVEENDFLKVDNYNTKNLLVNRDTSVVFYYFSHKENRYT